MSIVTTCIGAYPKPGYVKLPDWFNVAAGPDTAEPTQRWADAMRRMGEDAEAIIARGVEEVVGEQIEAGIDIPTDGEVPRENYIHYHCRHLNGFDFDNLTEKAVRGGTYSASLPTIRGPVSATREFLPADWRRAQGFSDKPVKITMPGPMTIADTNYDDYYHDPKKLGADLAAALNSEVLALAEAGCRHIQIDEPVFARRPADALAYGVENLERAFHGCPAQVTRTVHMCCGYPDRLDRDDYPKAEPQAYLQIADAMEDSSVQWLSSPCKNSPHFEKVGKYSSKSHKNRGEMGNLSLFMRVFAMSVGKFFMRRFIFGVFTLPVSIEDAHRHNDLALLERFATTTVIFGVVAIARSRVEPVEEIRARLCDALNHIDKARLVAAPDCGLGLLGRDLAREKMRNLSAAAKRI